MLRLSLFLLFAAFLFPLLAPLLVPAAVYLWCIKLGLSSPNARRAQEVLDGLDWHLLLAEAREHPEPLSAFPGPHAPDVAAYGVTPLPIPNQYLRMHSWRRAVEAAAAVHAAFVFRRPDGIYLGVALTPEELDDALIL